MVKTNYARKVNQQQQQVVTFTSTRQKRRPWFDKALLLAMVLLTGLLIVLTGQALTPNEVEAPLTKEVSTTKSVKAVVKEVEKATPAVKAVVSEAKPAKAVEVKAVKAVEVKVEKAQPVQEANEASIYNPEIPMPKEHQEFLYELCEERGLNYQETLAVIQHESVFDPNATNATNDFGYFQINQVNHATLANELNTENNPFNPYINMEWGTHMLSELYVYWSERGYHGQGLDDAVWSSYNKGKTGFLTTGHAVAYVNKMKASIETINNKF